MNEKKSIKPIGGNVLLKGIAEISTIELTNKNLPALAWRLQLEDIGTDCPQLEHIIKEEKQGIVILEYKDKVQQIHTPDNNYSLHKQFEILATQKLIVKDKIQIVEYFITPVYNITAFIETEEIKLERTIYNYISKA